MDREVTYRRLWQVSLPLLVSLLLEHLVSLTDTMFLGRIGETALAAGAIGGVYYIGMFVTAFGFSIGAQIIMARRNGEARFHRILPVFMQGCYFMAALSVVFVLLSARYSPGILASLVATPEVGREASVYLFWRSTGFLFAAVGTMFRAFFVGITKTKILGFNSAVIVVVNVALNYCLIFGHAGFPAMGIAGAGLASALAELAGVIFLSLYTGLGVDKRKYGLHHAWKLRLPMLGAILKTSVWTMLQSLLAISMWFYFFLAIEHLGERSLAVTNIARSVNSLIFTVVAAYASAAESLVSNQIGMGKPEHLFPVCRKALNLALLTVTPCILGIWLFPEAVFSLFTDNPKLVEFGVPSLYVMAGAGFSMAPAFVYSAAVSGTGNTLTGLLVEIATLVAYGLAVYLLASHWRVAVQYCWFADYIYNGVYFGLSWWYLKSRRWLGKQVG